MELPAMLEKHKACTEALDLTKTCETCAQADTETCDTCYNELIGLPVDPTNWQLKG